MEKCKFCEAELEEGVTLCPSCGKDNAEPVAEETAEAAEMPAQETAAATEETTEETAQEAAEEAAQVPAEEKTEEKTEIKEGIKATPAKMALAIVGIIAMTALIVVLLMGGLGGKNGETAAAPAVTEAVETVPATEATVPAGTGADDVTNKGTYTVSDEEAVAGASTVVATMGDVELTNARLQSYYWSYINSYLSSETGYQLMMYGLLNLAQPLDTQMCLVAENLTWQQYFLDCAINTWRSHQAMALEAQAQGYEITEEIQAQLEALPQDLEASCEMYGVENVEQLLAKSMGAGVTMEDFVEYQRLYYTGAVYYSDVTSAYSFTEEDIEKFFNEHEAEYEQNGVTREDKAVDVRHVLIMPEGATNETIRTETFSEEAWAASEKRAQELLDSWLAGDKTEDSFAVLANENTEDGNDSNMDGTPDGGLYTGVTKGQMVEEFEAWCFDEARQTGDTGIVKTMFGYHIMYYVDGQLIWPMYAEEDLKAMTENEFLMGIIEKHPVEVDYAAIQLATVVLQ